MADHKYAYTLGGVAGIGEHMLQGIADAVRAGQLDRRRIVASFEEILCRAGICIADSGDSQLCSRALLRLPGYVKRDGN